MSFLELISFFSSEKHPANLAGIIILIDSSNSVTYESIKKTLRIHPKTMQALMSYLEKEIIEKKEEFYFIKNKSFLKDVESENIPEQKKEIENKPSNLPIMLKINHIFHHLNELTGKNFRPTPNTSKSIQKFLLLGYSVESFILVNQYFSVAWNNPKMAQNINPGTLYNTKFPERIQIAENYFGIIKNNRDQVYEFMEFFIEEYNLHISSDQKYMFTNDDISSVLFWINSGYSLNNIKPVVSHIMKEWSTDLKFKQYLVPNIIFNSKWPTRVNNFKTSTVSILKINSIVLSTMIKNIKTQPNSAIIDEYNEFYLKSDNTIFDYVVKNIETFDKNCSFRLTPFVSFLEFYKQEAERKLTLFLNNLHQRNCRTSQDETKIVLDFVEWFGGWNHFQETDHYLWKNSIKGFLSSI